MIDVVGVLLSRLTAARAAFLDAALSSRAPAGTALSTADFTAGRAANLDSAVSTKAAAATALSTADFTAGRAANLDAAISGVLGSIKSMQYGTIAVGAAVTSATATITSVNTAKAAIFFLGYLSAGGDRATTCQVVLTNGTTVTCSRQAASNGSDVTGSFVVIEWN
jgi:hypothetical protein